VKTLLLQALVAALIVAAAIAVYDRRVIRPGQRIGVVDVGEVYRQKEAEFTSILTRAASEAERDQAMVMARAFAHRLPVALEELPRDCACLVMLKSAVAGTTPRTVDLTAALRHKVEAP
jgi:hypothetical protein